MSERHVCSLLIRTTDDSPLALKRRNKLCQLLICRFCGQHGLLRPGPLGSWERGANQQRSLLSLFSAPTRHQTPFLQNPVSICRGRPNTGLNPNATSVKRYPPDRKMTSQTLEPASRLCTSLARLTWHCNLLRTNCLAEPSNRRYFHLRQGQKALPTPPFHSKYLYLNEGQLQHGLQPHNPHVST